MSIQSVQELEKKLSLDNISYIPRVSDLTIDEFTHSYFLKRSPVIIERKLTNWGAFQRWTPQFFKEQYPDIMFDAQVMLPEVGSLGFLKLEDHSRTMSLKEILEMMMEPHGQTCKIGGIPAHKFPGIEKDCDFNVFMDLRDMPEAVYLWFGSRGTRSNLHWDPDDNFQAQVYGSKLVLLYAPQETKYLYPFEGDVRVSRVDPNGPDFNLYPRYRHAMVMIEKVGPGDMLFIPKGWWHQFRNEELTIGLNCFFGKHEPLYCFLRAATLSGVRQWVTIMRDFFVLGLLGRELDRRVRPGDPTGRYFYGILAGGLKRRLARFTKHQG